MKIFWSTTNNNDVARLKTLDCLVADIAMQIKKIRSCKDKITLGTWNVTSMKIKMMDIVKDEINQPFISILTSAS